MQSGETLPVLGTGFPVAAKPITVPKWLDDFPGGFFETGSRRGRYTCGTSAQTLPNILTDLHFDYNGFLGRF